jgi:Ca2+-binding RTX toxin-like protein
MMIYGLLLVSILSFPNVAAQNNSNFTISNEIPEPPVPKPKVDVSIEGTSADDKIRGGDGDDEISGNKGDDILSGHEGNDEA